MSRKANPRRSPKALSADQLKERGYIVADVEKVVPYTFIKQDLFGMFDLLAIHVETGNVLAAQPTSLANVSHRVNKITNHEHLAAVRKAGWSIEVHGWNWRDGEWKCRTVDLS